MECYGIPEGDKPEFYALPKHIRREVQRWVFWLNRIEYSQPKLPVIKQIAVEKKQKVGTIQGKLTVYRRYGWRGLINRAKYPSPPAKASAEPFRRFIHALWIANGKNYKNTHLQMLAIWKAKAPIPGYDGTPEKSSWNDCPDGWTYCNIRYQIKTFIKNFPDGATNDAL
jgi:hypothetical protein